MTIGIASGSFGKAVQVANARNTANTEFQTSIGLIKNSFAKYIVRPLNAFGLGGFVFDIEDETTVNLSADITDHYTESNSSIQDHIAIKPKKVTLKNFVGELVFRRDASTDTATQNLVRKLTILNSYLPVLSSAATQARNAYLDGSSTLDANSISFDASVRKAADLYGIVKNLTPPIKRQEQAYQYFKALMEQKILVSVQTPFEFMTSMAIESVSAKQSADTQDMSDFTITLKEMRFAQTQTAKFDPDRFQSRTQEQAQDVSEKGKTGGKDESLAVKVTDFLSGDSSKKVNDPDLGGFGNDGDFIDAPLPKVEPMLEILHPELDFSNDITFGG
jgi:hypothetical protein